MYFMRRCTAKAAQNSSITEADMRNYISHRTLSNTLRKTISQSVRRWTRKASLLWAHKTMLMLLPES